MDTLPDELLLQIISYLNHLDVVHLQLTSHRLRKLGRDNKAWRVRCFEKSPVELARKRQLSSDHSNSNLTALRQAVATLRGTSVASGNDTPCVGASNERNTFLANWDPRYPGEDMDYYQEYVQRHSPIAPVTWIEPSRSSERRSGSKAEAIGIGAIRDNGQATRIISPFDDGGISIWSINTNTDGNSTVGDIHLTGQSAPGLLTGLAEGLDRTAVSSDSRAMMTDVGAVECVSINDRTLRGLFAVQDKLQNVDLNTLQIVSSQSYPFPITALSQACGDVPVTVGTSSTVHLYDSRVVQVFQSRDESVKTELIGGLATRHALLTQPGPLSILHNESNDSIWVAGRFTHLLNYDRRCFPRLLGTIHSGARVSSLAALPYPHIPRDLDLTCNPGTSMASLQDAKAMPGSTLIAAGVYKGKGSLELYGLSESGEAAGSYRNRQTASTSKLLSVMPIGGHIVTSDSDGNIKFFERNAHRRIRTFNINELEPCASSSDHDQASRSDQARSDNVFSTTAMDAQGQGDIVQKLLPFKTCASSSGSSAQNPVLMLTGDGRLGVLSFGHRPAFTQRETLLDGHNSMADEDEGYVSGYSAKGERASNEAEEREDTLRANAHKAERRAREDAERQLAGRMRRVLEGQAREVRWMRGLGLEES